MSAVAVCRSSDLPRLVEQARVLDRDRGLVGKALLQRHLVIGEGREAVAVDDQRADRLPFKPQRRAGHRTRAGGASVRHAGPVGDGRIDIVEIGDMNLPVLGHDGAGHVAAADLELGERHAGADAHGAVTDTDHPGPPVAFRNVNGGARRAEQMHGRCPRSVAASPQHRPRSWRWCAGSPCWRSGGRAQWQARPAGGHSRPLGIAIAVRARRPCPGRRGH